MKSFKITLLCLRDVIFSSHANESFFLDAPAPTLELHEECRCGDPEEHSTTLCPYDFNESCTCEQCKLNY